MDITLLCPDVTWYHIEADINVQNSQFGLKNNPIKKDITAFQLMHSTFLFSLAIFILIYLKMKDPFEVLN